MDADTNIQAPRAMVHGVRANEAALRPRAVVATGVHEEAALRLPDTAELEGCRIENAALRWCDASVRRNKGRTVHQGVVLDHTLPVPFEQRAEGGAAGERRAKAPGKAIRHTELIRVTAYDTAECTGHFERASELAAGNGLGVEVPVVGARLRLSDGELHHHARREAHRVAAALLNQRPLAAHDERSSHVARPASIDEGGFMRYAAKPRITRYKNRLHVAVDSHQTPRAEQLEAIGDADGARETDLIDVGETLPAVEVRTKHAR